MVKNRKSIEGLDPYLPGKPIEDVKRELGLLEVVKLASNENPYGAPPSAVESAKSSFSDIFYYPDGSCHALKTALTLKLGVAAESIVAGCGADELISMLAQAFIETGDEAITAEITFGQYFAAVTAMGGEMVFTPMKNDGYDLEAILAALTPRTKLIFIANPNNPTGTLIRDAEKTAFLEKVPKNILVVFDEAYQEFVGDSGFTSSVPLVEGNENLVVLKTFSKIYGLASLRVGYGVMNPALAASLEKIRKPFNVSIPAQDAAVAALSEDWFVNETRERNLEVKRYCYEMLDKLGVSYTPSEANFIAISPKIDSGAAFDALLRRGYIVRPNPFGMNGRLRVTLGTMEQMKGFFRALEEILT